MSHIESSTQSLPLTLASGNPHKIDQLQKYSEADKIIVLDPLYHEDDIKEQLSVSPQQGMDYVAAISREKLLVQREQARTLDHEESDYAIIVSDSVIMVPMPDGEYLAVSHNRLDTPEREAIRDRINKQNEVIFVGAVTFGRKMGESAFTVLTYLKVPLAHSLKSFPISTELIPEIVDANRGFEAGFISYELDEDGKMLQPAFRPVKYNQQDFESVRPYISGLAPQVIEFADRSSQFDKAVAPFLEESISVHPFNTTSYYFERIKHSDDDLMTFYTNLVKERQTFFEKYGGNCSLFTLQVTDKLQEMGYNPRVILYPLNNLTDQYQRGHSGILVDAHHERFFIDPGLTIPYPIPISGHIPLYPIHVGSKIIVTEVKDYSGDLIPDLVSSNKNKIIVFTAQTMISPEEFEEELPKILSDIHKLRSYFKVDVHDTKGVKELGIIINVRNSTVTINDGMSLMVLPFSEVTLEESLSRIQGIFEEKGGKFDITEQLTDILRELKKASF